MKPARPGLLIGAEYSKGYCLSKLKSGRQRRSRILITKPNWRRRRWMKRCVRPRMQDEE